MCGIDLICNKHSRSVHSLRSHVFLGTCSQHYIQLRYSHALVDGIHKLHRKLMRVWRRRKPSSGRDWCQVSGLLMWQWHCSNSEAIRAASDNVLDSARTRWNWWRVLSSGRQMDCEKLSQSSQRTMVMAMMQVVSDAMMLLEPSLNTQHVRPRVVIWAVGLQCEMSETDDIGYPFVCAMPAMYSNWAS